MPFVDKPSTTDLLDVLSKRRALLQLIDTGVTDKRELEDELGCSRSTLNRGIRELEGAGLLARPRAELGLSLAGEVAAEAFSELWEPIVSAVPLLGHVDGDAPFHGDILQGATVVKSAMPNPDAPVNALADHLDSAEHVRATVPTRSSPFVRVFADRIDSLEAVEFLLAESCLEYVRTASDPPLSTIVRSEACSLGTTGDRPPYCLVLFDADRFWLGIYDEQGKIVGAIVNDEPDAMEWARETYRELRSDRT